MEINQTSEDLREKPSPAVSRDYFLGFSLLWNFLLFLLLIVEAATKSSEDLKVSCIGNSQQNNLSFSCVKSTCYSSRGNSSPCWIAGPSQGSCGIEPISEDLQEACVVEGAVGPFDCAAYCNALLSRSTAILAFLICDRFISSIILQAISLPEARISLAAARVFSSLADLLLFLLLCTPFHPGALFSPSLIAFIICCVFSFLLALPIFCRWKLSILSQPSNSEYLRALVKLPMWIFYLWFAGSPDRGGGFSALVAFVDSYSSGLERVILICFTIDLTANCLYWAVQMGRTRVKNT